MFGLVRMWLTGLLAVAIWIGAGWLLYEWSQRLPDPRPQVFDVPPPAPVDPQEDVNVDRPTAKPQALPPKFGERLRAWKPTADLTTACLAGGVLLALLAAGGGRGLWWLGLSARQGADDPRHERDPEFRRIRRPDGSEIHVEFHGPADAPPIVLTHGWGASSTEWYYLRRQLGDRFRLIAWDLPGLGLSKGPTNRDHSQDKYAADLLAVLTETTTAPAILLGHSIGGMITLNFCKRFPDEMAARVAGLVLVHTSHTNPLRMTENRWLAVPLQKPVLEPLAYLMIAFAPVVWVMNVLSYLNGSLHRSNHKQLFAGTETWGQLEFVSRYVPYVWPATYARGVLGMLHWDATDALPRITVPTLVVAAAEDRVTLAEASQIIADRCPAARLTTLRPAGHMGLIERHEEFGRAVAAFVEECTHATASAFSGGPENRR